MSNWNPFEEGGHKGRFFGLASSSGTRMLMWKQLHETYPGEQISQEGRGPRLSLVADGTLHRADWALPAEAVWAGPRVSGFPGLEARQCTDPVFSISTKPAGRAGGGAGEGGGKDRGVV